MVMMVLIVITIILLPYPTLPCPARPYCTIVLVYLTFFFTYLTGHCSNTYIYGLAGHPTPRHRSTLVQIHPKIIHHRLPHAAPAHHIMFHSLRSPENMPRARLHSLR